MDTEIKDYTKVQKNGNGKSVLAGLVVGSLVGAGAMLLLAPQAGSKTRAQVQEGVQQLRDQTTEKVKDGISQAKSKANQIKMDVQVKADELQHQGKDLIVKQLDRVSHMAESGKKAIQGSGNNKNA